MYQTQLTKRLIYGNSALLQIQVIINYRQFINFKFESIFELKNVLGGFGNRCFICFLIVIANLGSICLQNVMDTGDAFALSYDCPR